MRQNHHGSAEMELRIVQEHQVFEVSQKRLVAKDYLQTLNSE